MSEMIKASAFASTDLVIRDSHPSDALDHADVILVNQHGGQEDFDHPSLNKGPEIQRFLEVQRDVGAAEVAYTTWLKLSRAGFHVILASVKKRRRVDTNRQSGPEVFPMEPENDDIHLYLTRWHADMVRRLKGLAQAARRALILDIHTMAPGHPASLVRPSASDPQSLTRDVDTWNTHTRLGDPHRNRPVTISDMANGVVAGNPQLSANLALAFASEGEHCVSNGGILYDRQTHTGAALMAEGEKGVVVSLPKVKLTPLPQANLDLAAMQIYKPRTDRMGLIIANAVSKTLTGS